MKEEIYRLNQSSGSQELIRYTICGTTHPNPHYRIDRVASSIACIEYIEEGCGTVTIDGETFYPAEGDSYFLQAGHEHRYFSDAERPWKKHFLNLSGPLLDSMTESCGLRGIYYFRGLDLRAELAQILTLGRAGQGDCTAEITAVLTGILLKMHGHVRESAEPSGIAREMKDFLDTQITSPFRLELLCRRIARSESQTIRIFRRAFGVTPYGYVLDKKLAFARRLLEDTSLSVGEIADKLCFADEYYFSGIFKRKTGMTPGECRRSASRRKGDGLGGGVF